MVISETNCGRDCWLFIKLISFSSWARLHFMGCLVVWWLGSVLASGMGMEVMCTKPSLSDPPCFAPFCQIDVAIMY